MKQVPQQRMKYSDINAKPQARGYTACTNQRAPFAIIKIKSLFFSLYHPCSIEFSCSYIMGSLRKIIDQFEGKKGKSSSLLGSGRGWRERNNIP